MLRKGVLRCMTVCECAYGRAQSQKKEETTKLPPTYSSKCVCVCADSGIERTVAVGILRRLPVLFLKKLHPSFICNSAGGTLTENGESNRRCKLIFLFYNYLSDIFVVLLGNSDTPKMVRSHRPPSFACTYVCFKPSVYTSRGEVRYMKLIVYIPLNGTLDKSSHVPKNAILAKAMGEF